MENEGYTKITIPRDISSGIGFDFDIFVPDDVRDDSNLLLCFASSFDEREKRLLKMLKAPIMIVDTKDKSGDSPYNFDQFEMSALLDENGEIRPYGGVDKNISFIEQYRRAISKAYTELKGRDILRQDLEEKIDVEGYSYHGVRAQRFAMLAPEKIRSVFVGGAYSSIPMPLESLDGKDLVYPTGFKGVEKILGEESTDRVLSDYKNVAQIIYVAEQELRYDGSFSRDGRRLRDKSGKRIDFSSPTVSQHDISPDVVDVVLLQNELFGTDINDRAEKVMDILRQEGCALLKSKIYEGVDHHWSDESKRLGSLNDMVRAIMSMDGAAIKSGFNPHETEIDGFVGGADRVDTTYEEKREALQSMIVGEGITEEDFYQAVDSLISTMVLNPEDDAYLFVEPKKFMLDFDSRVIENKRALRDLSYVSLNDKNEKNVSGFHFTSKNNIGGIYERGILALKGDNSSGNLGKEAINKSFLSYGEEGALQIFNRTITASRQIAIGGIRQSKTHSQFLPDSVRFRNDNEFLSMIEGFEFARQYMSDNIYFTFDVIEAAYPREEEAVRRLDEINGRTRQYKNPETGNPFYEEISVLDKEISRLKKMPEEEKTSLSYDVSDRIRELSEKRNRLSIALRQTSKVFVDSIRGEIENPEEATIDRIDYNEEKCEWSDQIVKPHNVHTRIIEDEDGLHGVIIRPREVISVDGKTPATGVEAMQMAYSRVDNIQKAKLSGDPNLLDLFFEYNRMVEAYGHAGLLIHQNGRDVVDLERIDIYPGLDDLAVRAERAYIDFCGKTEIDRDTSKEEADTEAKKGYQDVCEAATKDSEYNFSNAKETTDTMEKSKKEEELKDKTEEEILGD